MIDNVKIPEFLSQPLLTNANRKGNRGLVYCNRKSGNAMNQKTILIVDDETPILSVLKRSLEKLEAGYMVFTAEDGNSALNQLKLARFDLVIADYKMAGMDGLELLGAVRSLQPETRTILMTAYGNDRVQADARRLQVYRYLTKPLEIDDFRQVVKSALSDLAVVRPGILILADEQYDKIVLSLKRLQLDVGARCVILAHIEGHAVAHTGNLDKFPLETVTPLLGGCIAGLEHAGRAIDRSEETTNLIYRESTAGDLYVINIGSQLLLMIVIDRASYNTKLGTVWYAAQQVASMLLVTVVHKQYADPEELLGSGLETAVSNELDKLLCSNSKESKLDESDRKR